MAMDDNESCGSRAMELSSPKQNRLHRQKLEVFNQVLTRLQDLNLEEVKLPGFEDHLWLHFNCLPVRYASDVNVERAEDVLMHKRLLDQAEDPPNGPAFDVRLVQVHPMYKAVSTNTVDVNSSVKDEIPSIHPPPTFGSSPNLQALEIHDNKAHINHGESDINSTSRSTRELVRSDCARRHASYPASKVIDEPAEEVQHCKGSSCSFSKSEVPFEVCRVEVSAAGSVAGLLRQ